MTEAELFDRIVATQCKLLCSFKRAREIVLKSHAALAAPSTSSGAAPATPGAAPRDLHREAKDVQTERGGSPPAAGSGAAEGRGEAGAKVPEPEAVRAHASRKGVDEGPLPGREPERHAPVGPPSWHSRALAAATPERQRRQVGSIGAPQARERDVAPVVKFVPVAAPSPQTVAALFGEKPMGCLFIKAEDPSDFAFRCGAPTKAGQPWCDRHRGIVFNPDRAPFTRASIARAASYFRNL